MVNDIIDELMGLEMEPPSSNHCGGHVLTRLKTG